MNEKSRIRFNPSTREIEVEGSEEFVKTYFEKIQAIMSKAAGETAKGAKAGGAFSVVGTRKEDPSASGAGRSEESGAGARMGKAGETGGEKVTNISTVVGLIQESVGGISTAQLKEKTGLAESQIWNIVARAAKEGKIRKMKRGLYGAV